MNGGAARLWWLLRHFGHDDVAVLDGGIGAWLGPLRAGEEEIEPAVFVAVGAHGRHDRGRGARGAARRARAHGRRRAPAGALPRRGGADRPGRRAASRAPSTLRIPRAAPGRSAASAEEIVAYCGSGVTAAVTLLRLAQAGRADAKLYPGSWSDWCGRGLPAETG